MATSHITPTGRFTTFGVTRDQSNPSIAGVERYPQG
jgi:hypothetical protein